MVDGLAAEAEAKGQALRRPEPDGPLWVEGDRGRLGQVLVNLVTNSIRYTPRGGHIRVDVDADGGAGRVRVRDDGQGMDASMLEHLFEPFRQADDSLARSGGGLGIGLSIAHGIVALHGGTLEAFSEGPGRGSELVLRLPLTDRPEVGVDAAPEDVAGRQRVLLVDDNRDIRESTSMLLQVLGHDVVTCADAGEALARIDGARPSLVLVDIGLPDMDGYTLARRLRAAHGPSLRLVAVTGYATDDHRRRSREAGFDDHLVKPVSLEQLEHLLVGC
jgi:CheY-like chemotaxis protein